MSFPVPAFENVRDGILRDILNQNDKAVTGADSDYRVRANATAAAVEGLYQHQAWIARQIFPDASDEDILERHAARKGITRKAANAATGTITFTGLEGAIVGVGTECRALDEQVYAVTEEGVIPSGGTITLQAQASAAGLAGNQGAGATLSLTAAPSGVDSAATIAAMSGGTGTESSDSLLSRLLSRLRQPPAGGNQADYERWALDVPGITQAWCYPTRRGTRTVDVAVLSNGEPPSAELLAIVQAAIDDQRPVGGDFLALCPQQVPVDVTASLVLNNTVTLEEVTVQAQALEAAYFATLAPGDTAYRSRIFSLLSDIDGVIDVTLTSPAANTITIVDATRVEIPALGALTLSEA
jgi:uncharacterized phage protein gp47/JayE